MEGDDQNKLDRLRRKLNKKVLRKHIRKVEGATIRHTHKFISKRWGNVRDSQRHIIMWIIIMGLLITATGLQLMWFQNSYKTTTSETNGTYAEAVLGPINSLNPLFANSNAEQSVNYLMFSRLLNYDKTGNLNYDLATNIKTNDNKTVYTINIRPDVKWHDGIKLTTSDIAFTVGLIKNPTTRTSIIGWQNISVKVIDETAIEFTLQSPFAPFENFLTFPIVPEHILGNVAVGNVLENNFSNNPIGSGPFKMLFSQNVDQISGNKVIYMARNDNYYKGFPKLARFQLHIYNDKESIVQALKSNEINAASGLSIKDVDSVDLKKYSVSSEPIKSGVYAIINTTSELLSDQKIRKAIQLATDTNAIRKELPLTANQLDLPFINGMLIGDIPKASPFDIVAAKKALDDDGWVVNANGIREKAGKELRLSVVTIKNDEFERVLEILVGQWRAIGINIDTKVIDSKDVTQSFVQTTLQPRDYDILLYQLNIGADPDVFAFWHSSQISTQGFNFSNYSNAISDDALLSARTRVEPDLRNAKYLTFAMQWLSDVPAIGLYQSTTQYVHNRNVNSFDESNVLISPIDRYGDVLKWSVGTKSVFKTP